MNVERLLEKYIGNEVELQTDLDVAECARRLRAEFQTPQLRIRRETVSDTELAGRITGTLFTLRHNKKWAEDLMRGENVLYRSRSFEGRLVPRGGGTLVKGRYGYSLEALFWDAALVAVGALFAGAVGVLLLLGGTAAGPRAWGVILLTVLLVGGGFYFLRGLRPVGPGNRRASGSVRKGAAYLVAEKEYIVRYLQERLDARVVKE